MLVRDWMSPDPVTITRDTTVREARRLLRYYGIRHLVVVDDDRVVGVVSDRDVRLEISSVRTAINNGTVAHLVYDGRTVDQIMSRPVHSITLNEPVEAAARLMLSRRISALPVVEVDDRLRGMITTTDCLLASLCPPVGIGTVGEVS